MISRTGAARSLINLAKSPQILAKRPTATQLSGNLEDRSILRSLGSWSPPFMCRTFPRTFLTAAQAVPGADILTEDVEEVAGVAAEDGTSGNRVAPVELDPKDRSRYIPWEVSVRYMKSEAYKKTYGNDPVYKNYRRQHKGQIPKPHTRKSCIWDEGTGKPQIHTGSPCPLCRDEYLVLDYRHTELLKQFISPFTGEFISWHITGLCQRKHRRMVVELEKAKYFGTMTFKVPFRRYNYEEYYDQSLLSSVQNQKDVTSCSGGSQ